MKNIVLIDTDEIGLYKEFIHSDDFNVIACIIFHEKDKQYCIESGIKHVLTLQEADFIQHINNFSFELINTHRDTQRKVEFGMMRSLSSNMLIANKYYNMLCWWEEIFRTHTIDCVLVNGIPHGYLPETTLLDIAQSLKIPSYTICPIIKNYSSIMRYDTKNNIRVSHPIDTKSLTAHLFDTVKHYCNDNVIHKILHYRKILIWIHKWGGAVALDIAHCIRHLTLSISMGFYNNMRLVEKLYSFWRLKEMEKFYKKHAISFDNTRKYIFYAVHFEPEAGTGVFVDLQNQLTIIQILHSCLPQGWKIYIKEHPHQFDINNVREHFYLINFQFFKDKSFYEEILKFDNVVLIDYNTPSQQLMLNSQAVATINGSIILEATHYAKACVTFDNAIMPITQSRLFDNIHIFQSVSKLRDFFNQLDKEELTFTQPTPEQYQELTQFYFDHSKPEIIVQSILADLEA